MSEQRTKDVKAVSITWKGVSAYVKDKAILNDCSGFCRAGEMLAIMGPSGAGKTTLLSLLSKKNSPSLTTQGAVLMSWLRFWQIIWHLPKGHFSTSEHLCTKTIFFFKHSQSDVPIFLSRNSWIRSKAQDSKQGWSKEHSDPTSDRILTSKMRERVCRWTKHQRNIRRIKEKSLHCNRNGVQTVFDHFGWTNFRSWQQ